MIEYLHHHIGKNTKNAIKKKDVINYHITDYQTTTLKYKTLLISKSSVLV